MWSYITNQHLPYNHVKYWDIRTHFEIQIFWHLNSSWRGRNHERKEKHQLLTKEKRKKRRKHSANWPVSKSSHHISQTKSFSSGTLPVNYSTEPFFFLYYGMFCVYQCRCQKHSQNDTCLLQLHLFWIHTTSSEARDALNISIMYTLFAFLCFSPY